MVCVGIYDCLKHANCSREWLCELKTMEIQFSIGLSSRSGIGLRFSSSGRVEYEIQASALGFKLQDFCKLFAKNTPM